VEQWVQLADAFHNWPFKPDVREDETYVQLDSMEYAPFVSALSEGTVASLDAETVDDDGDGDDELELEEGQE